jgi:hypothetical protein
MGNASRALRDLSGSLGSSDEDEEPSFMDSVQSAGSNPEDEVNDRARMRLLASASTSFRLELESSCSL